MGSSGSFNTRRYCRACRVVLPLLLVIAAPAAADIYEWEWVDWFDHSLGRQASATLCPDGAGVTVGPGADLTGRDLTGAYLDVGDADGVDFGNSVLTNAFVTGYAPGASFDRAWIGGVTFTDSLISPEQVYGTASYAAGDLRDIYVDFHNDWRGMDLSGQDLRGATFAGSAIGGADFRDARLAGATIGGFTYGVGSDFRGTSIVSPWSLFDDSICRNVIYGDGEMELLNIKADDEFLVRDHALALSIAGDVTIHSEGRMTFVFEDTDWTSIVYPGIQSSVDLDGTLALSFADAVDPSAMVGSSFRLFDWGATAVNGRFDDIAVQPGHEWDTTDLYAGGTATLLAVPEPSTGALLLALFATGIRRRA